MEKTKINLTETVRAAQKGDVSAFEALYNAYSKHAYYLALKMLKNKEDAEDLTQEVFVAAFLKISDLKTAETFPSWLNRIAANKCADVLRKKSMLSATADFQEAQNFKEADFFEEQDPSLIPEEHLDNAETARIIVQIVDNLPLAQRVCVYYYYYERLTVSQIAETLGVSQSAVKYRLSAARERIRQELEKLEKEDGLKLYQAIPLSLAPAIKFAFGNVAPSASPAGFAGVKGVITTQLAGTASSVTSNVAGSVSANASGTASSASSGASGVSSASSAASAGSASSQVAQVAGVSLKVKLIAGAAGVLLVGGITAGVIASIANSKPNTPFIDEPKSNSSLDDVLNQIESQIPNTPDNNSGAQNKDEAPKYLSVPPMLLNAGEVDKTKIAYPVQIEMFGRNFGAQNQLGDYIITFDEPTLDLTENGIKWSATVLNDTVELDYYDNVLTTGLSPTFISIEFLDENSFFYREGKGKIHVSLNAEYETKLAGMVDITDGVYSLTRYDHHEKLPRNGGFRFHYRVFEEPNSADGYFAIEFIFAGDYYDNSTEELFDACRELIHVYKNNGDVLHPIDENGNTVDLSRYNVYQDVLRQNLYQNAGVTLNQDATIVKCIGGTVTAEFPAEDNTGGNGKAEYEIKFEEYGPDEEDITEKFNMPNGAEVLLEVDGNEYWNDYIFYTESPVKKGKYTMIEFRHFFHNESIKYEDGKAWFLRYFS